MQGYAGQGRNAPEIEIPLARVHVNKLGPKEEYFSLIHDTYTSQYLERLGVEPTERNKKLVARHAPLKDCDIESSWQDGSAVAGELRIYQAPIGKTVEQVLPKAKTGGDLFGGHPENSLGGLRKPYARTAPPEVPDAAEFAKRLEQARQALHIPEGQMQAKSDKDQSLIAMQMRSIAASEGCNPVLVEELERARRRARGDDMRSESEPTLVQWGDDGFRELENLKGKFILPFATERPQKGTLGMVVVPWQSPDLRARMNLEVVPEHVDEVRVPIAMTLEQIMQAGLEYAEQSLPLELLTCRRDPWLFAAIREQLASPQLTRLTGLLSHLLYWMVFGHLHPPARRLPRQTQQSMVLTLQELWSCLIDLGRNKQGRKLESVAGMSLVLSVFILALKRGVEHVFKRQYSKAFGDLNHGADLEAQLVDQLNILVMNIFDPDCTYASFGALDSSADAIRLWKKLSVLHMKLGLTPASKMLGRQFRTSPPMLLLMHDDGAAPLDPKTRKFLQRSSSDAALATISMSPAEVPASSSMRSSLKLAELKHRTLYKTATKRIALAGREVVGTSSATSL